MSHKIFTPNVFEVSEWETVKYPSKEVGHAKIVNGKYKKGLYYMEGVEGYDFFKVVKPIPCTTLEIDGKQVMVDDPLHWYGMRALAEACKGRVLVGGLGLGLIVHHLVKNKKVKEIIVVEYFEDVIKLIKPLLPKDKRLKILHDDIYNWRFEREAYDSIVLDIWVWDNREKIRECGTDYKTHPERAWFKFQALHPEASVYYWGSRDPKKNPAVKKRGSLLMEPFIRAERREDLPTYVADEARTYVNDKYQVSVEKLGHGWLWLSIKRKDKEPIHDWRELQAIKNAIAGKEREAVELYPAESRLVDTSNEFHLFVLPLNTKFPFGFKTRLIVKGHKGGWHKGSAQREFNEGEEPADAISVEQSQKMLEKFLERAKNAKT